MNNKRYLFFIFIFLLIGICSFVYNTINPYKSRTISSNIKKIATTTNYLYLNKVTSFDWDKAFILEDPYIGGDALDKIVGVKCNLERLNNESKRRIIFIKGEKFVYSYVYSWSNFQFKPLGKVISKEQCRFNISKDDTGRIILEFS